MHIPTRSRTITTGGLKSFDKNVKLDPEKTLIIVVDMWDKHWCTSATLRAIPLAEKINVFLINARKMGFHICHAPSETLKYYRRFPQRLRMVISKPKLTISRFPMWTGIQKWERSVWPIDDTDGGCPDTPKCRQYKPWSKQTDLITIFPEDIISASGKEIYFHAQTQGINTIIYCGVHLNMCILSRSFGIRSFSRTKFRLFFLRDLIDIVYNPRKKPLVPHFKATNLIIEHVERYFCPSILSQHLFENF